MKSLFQTLVRQSTSQRLAVRSLVTTAVGYQRTKPLQKTGSYRLQGTCAKLKYSQAATAQVSYDSVPEFQLLDSSTLDHANRFLITKWQNGQSEPFPFVWLRDNCRCPDCYDPSSRARKLTMPNLDTKISPTSAVVSSNGETVVVTWEGGHVSEYPAEWLQYRSFGEASKQRRQEIYGEPKVHWGKDLTIPRLDYETVVNTDEGMLEWLTTLNSIGLTVLENTPLKIGQCKRLCEKVAFIMKTNYGESFTVMGKNDPSNLAYTTMRLGLHIDLPFYDHTPQIQLLHCIKQTEQPGGDNEFSDGFYAADQIKIKDPKAFKTLTTSLIDFWDYGTDYYQFYKVFQKNIVEMDQFGVYRRIHYNNQVRDSFLNAPVEKVQQIYEALKMFDDELYHPDNMVETKLRSGDLVVFDNTRVLHGRKGYEPGGVGGERHLEGSYMNWDEGMSRIRVLKTKLNRWRHTQKAD